jgi:MFS family permease
MEMEIIQQIMAWSSAALFIVQLVVNILRDQLGIEGKNTVLAALALGPLAVLGLMFLSNLAITAQLVVMAVFAGLVAGAATVGVTHYGKMVSKNREDE